MSDKLSADGLVTETSSGPHNSADLAVKLDPAKTPPTAPKPAKKKVKRSFARRVAATAAANKAADAKVEAASAAAVAGEEHARAHSDELRAAYEAARLNQVDRFTDLPENSALQLRLADTGHFVDGALDAGREDFGPGAQGTTYLKALDIGPDCGPVHVVEVWVIAASGEAVCCAVGPIVGGNGKHAQIPAQHLLF